MESPARGIHGPPFCRWLTVFGRLPPRIRHTSGTLMRASGAGCLDKMVPWQPTLPRAPSGPGMHRSTPPAGRRDSSDASGGCSWLCPWCSSVVTATLYVAYRQSTARHPAADPHELPVRPQRCPAHLAPRGRGPQDRAASQISENLAARGARDRGCRVLQPPRGRRAGHHHRRLDRSGEARHRRGRVDDHAAAREERLCRPIHRESRRLQEYSFLPVPSRRRSARRCSRSSSTRAGKDQILAKYLNTVYFGHGAYGAEAAAQTYFGKPRASSPSARAPCSPRSCMRPSLYDPIKSTFDNKFRRDYTLDQMAKYGYISTDEAASLKAQECCGIPAISDRTTDHGPAHSEYFVDYTREWLFDSPVRQRKVYGSGLQVTTSLDLRFRGRQRMQSTRTCRTPTTTPTRPSSRSTTTPARYWPWSAAATGGSRR